MRGNIVIDAFKKAYDSGDIVLRFHEYRGGHTGVRLKLAVPITGWTVCNMLEQETREQVQNDCVELFLRPFEIVTVKLHTIR